MTEKGSTARGSSALIVNYFSCSFKLTWCLICVITFSLSVTTRSSFLIKSSITVYAWSSVIASICSSSFNTLTCCGVFILFDLLTNCLLLFKDCFSLEVSIDWLKFIISSSICCFFVSTSCFSDYLNKFNFTSSYCCCGWSGIVVCCSTRQLSTKVSTSLYVFWYTCLCRFNARLVITDFTLSWCPRGSAISETSGITTSFEKTAAATTFSFCFLWIDCQRSVYFAHSYWSNACFC